VFACKAALETYLYRVQKDYVIEVQVDPLRTALGEDETGKGLFLHNI